MFSGPSAASFKLIYAQMRLLMHSLTFVSIWRSSRCTAQSVKNALENVKKKNKIINSNISFLTSTQRLQLNNQVSVIFGPQICFFGVFLHRVHYFLRMYINHLLSFGWCLLERFLVLQGAEIFILQKYHMRYLTWKVPEGKCFFFLLIQ